MLSTGSVLSYPYNTFYIPLQKLATVESILISSTAASFPRVNTYVCTNIDFFFDLANDIIGDPTVNKISFVSPILQVYETLFEV